jgi:RimJ/RimL family protein N-acetyltransferase
MLLIQLSEEFSVLKLDPAEPIPQAPQQSNFWSIALTHDELSLVCATHQAPGTGILARADDWTAFRVAGTMDFALTGVISSISEPIAAAGLGIFVMSTFDTDYILVKTLDTASAVNIWRASGISVIEPIAQTARLVLVDLTYEVKDIALHDRSNKVWALDYPTEEEFLIAGLAVSMDPEHVPALPQSFQVRMRSTGEAIGGIYFKAESSLGSITATEIGYSIVRSRRGDGFATEAISGIISIARARGIRYLSAETTSVNLASERALLTNGFEKYITAEQLNSSPGSQNNSLFLLELQ